MLVKPWPPIIFDFEVMRFAFASPTARRSTCISLTAPMELHTNEASLRGIQGRTGVPGYSVSTRLQLFNFNHESQPRQKRSMLRSEQKW
jgi:hypothetical protein